MSSVPVLLVWFVAGFSAIVIRHDIADGEYLEYAQQFENLIVHLNLEEEGAPPDGEGTLVEPRWVLTAAHVAAYAEPGHFVTVGGVAAEIERIVLHPGWGGGVANDIALIGLTDAVQGVAPVPLYRAEDETGKIVTFVGRGDTGTGLTGPVGNDRRLRAARNRVEGAEGGRIRFRFDAPGDPNVVHLEGISGPGDSGGPAFVELDDTHYLIGVSSSQDTRATNGLRGRYGVIEYYVRVSQYLDWIDRTITGGGESR